MKVKQLMETRVIHDIDSDTWGLVFFILRPWSFDIIWPIYLYSVKRDEDFRIVK